MGIFILIVNTYKICMAAVTNALYYITGAVCNMGRTLIWRIRKLFYNPNVNFAQSLYIEGISYDGNVTMSSDLVLSTRINSVDFNPNRHNALKKLAAFLPKDAVNNLEDILLVCLTFDTTSQINMCASGLKFVKILNKVLSGKDISLVESLGDKLAAVLIDYDRQLVQYHAAAGPIDNARILASSPLGQNIIKFLCIILVDPFQSLTNVTIHSSLHEQLNKYMMNKIAKESVFSIVDLLIDSMDMLITNGPTFLSTGRVTDLVSTKYSSFFNEVSYLTDMFPKRTGDLIEATPDRINDVVFAERLQKCLNDGELLLNIVQVDNSLTKLLTLVKQEVGRLKILNSKMTQLEENSKNRQVPMCIGIFGGVGVGKSSEVRKLATMFCQLCKYPFDKSGNVYYRNTNESFWSGYTRNCVVTVLDDLGACNPDKAHDDKSLTEFIGMINTAPFSTPQASVEEKGKAYFVSKFVMTTSNSMYFNAQKFVSTPEAVWRRFDNLVHFKVKPEFCVEDLNGNSTETLDTEKVAAYTKLTGIEKPQVHNFIVHKYIPTSNKGVHGQQTKIVGEFDTREKLYCWFRDAVNLYNIRAKQNLANTDPDMNLCEHQIPLSECSICKNASDLPPLVPAALNRFHIAKIMFVPYIFKRLAISLWEDYWDNCLNMYTIYFHVTMLYYFYATDAVHRYDTVRKITKDPCNYYLSVFYPSNHNHIVEESFSSKYGGHIILFGALLYYIVLIYAQYNVVKTYLTAGKEYDPDEAMPPKPPDNPWVYKTPPSTIPHTHPGRQIESDILADKIKLATRKVLIHTPGNVVQVYALNIKAQLYVTVKHVFDVEALDGQWKIAISPYDASKEYVTYILNRECMFFHATKDLVFFNLLKFRPGKDLSKYFLKVPYNQHCKGDLISSDTRSIDLSAVYRESYRYTNTDSSITRTSRGYCVQHPGFQGNCGTSFMINNNNGGVFISGIVVAALIGIETMILDVVNDDIDKAIKFLNKKFVYVTACKSGTISYDNYTEVALHSKSRVNWADQDINKFNYITSLNVPLAHNKSRVRKTILFDDVVERFGPTNHCAPDLSKGNKPTGWYDAAAYAFSNKSRDLQTIPEDLVACVAEQYFQDVKSVITPLRKLSYQDAINGQDGVRFIDGLNMNTSGGFGFPGVKSAYFESRENQDGSLRYAMGEKLRDEVDRIKQCYSNSEMVHPIFNASLKDEVVSLTKFKAGKNRCFFAAPVSCTIIGRQYLLPLVKIIQENNLVFELAAGCNASSRDWTGFARYLNFSDHHINGDYARYDIDIPFVVLYYTAFVILRLCKEGGYQEHHLTIIETYLMDTIYHLTNWDGDIVNFYKGHASGHMLTVIFNSIANSLLVRMAYADANYDVATFKKYVKLLTYGDDNIAAVSPERPRFTQSFMTEFFNRYDITYTPADKEMEVVDNVPFDEMSFLKRRFIYHAGGDLYLAPLEVKSCVKSMSWRVGETLNDLQHSVEVLMNYQWESVHYGEEVFQENSLWIEYMIKKHHLSYYMNGRMKTYYQIYDSMYNPVVEVDMDDE